MIKLYGNPLSTCTRKVLMTLAETKTPFEMNVIDFTKGEHKQAPHLARQPFGRVPALNHDGFELFESRAMARYIDQLAGGVLVPADAKARAKMEQWISVETSEFTGHAMKYIYEYIFQRPQEPGVLDAAKKSLDVTLGVMNDQLGKTKFIAGDTFTFADVCFMPYVEYMMPTPAKAVLEPYANVMKWWGAVSDRATWRTATGKA